jgi:hypothetical protein
LYVDANTGDLKLNQVDAQPSGYYEDFVITIRYTKI